jgi:hypothetical protein
LCVQYRELKSKYSDSLLDYKRLQDRFDSLEFYSKTSTNSSLFHNLNRSSDSYTSSSNPIPRARTPVSSTIGSSTTLPRTTRLPSSSSSYLNGSSSYGGGGGAALSSSRQSSRQSSVERDPVPLPSYHGATSYGTSTYRLADLSSTVRSRQSSPLRSYESSAYYGSSRALNSLPPVDTYRPTTYDSYSRSRREPSSERSLASLRQRREASQERAIRPSTTSSALLKSRRFSFVDHSPSKYY